MGSNCANEYEIQDKTFSFLTIDSSTIDYDSYKIPVSASTAYNYSYEVWLRFELDQEPNISVDNLRLYTDNTIPATGVYLMMSTSRSSAEAGPIDTLSTVLTFHTAYEQYYNATDHYLEIPLQPGDNLLDTAGESSYFAVLQLKVHTSASQGSIGVIPIYLAYEER